MITVSPFRAAISAHRAAYDACRVASDDEAEDACCAMADALDALAMAACAFPVLGRALQDGAAALLAHRQWWLAEEAVYADDYQPHYGILLSRAADLAAVQRSAPDAYPSVRPDPIFAALGAVEAADQRAMRILAETAGDDGPEANARFEAEDRRRGEIEKTFAATIPTTLAGLTALVRRYASTASDPESEGLTHLIRALISPRPPAYQRRPAPLHPGEE